MNFEANRKKILADLQKQRDRKKVSAGKPAAQYTQSGKSNEKKQLAFFAQKSLFTNNLASSLSNIFKVTMFYDVDKATDFIIENSIKYVIIDIDPPSDYHQAANFLTVVKTLSAGTIIFVCTKDKDDSRARSLFSHGGIIIEKPVSIPDLVELMADEEDED